MNITFILIGKNEEKNIANCFNSVVSFIKQNKIINHEIIYVDSDSSDNSINIMSAYENVRIFKISGDTNAAIARNVGAQNSTKDYLFFIDGDMEIISSFFKYIVNDNNIIYNFISGEYIGHYYKNDKLVYTKNYYNLKSDIFQNTTGGVFIIKKTLWDNVSGMKLKYRRCQDLDLGLRLSKIGVPLLRKKETIAIHHTISYYDSKRLWIDLFNGNQLYQKSILYRDHILNYRIYFFLYRDLTMFVLFLAILFSILFSNIFYINFYFILLITKSIYKYKNGVSKNILTRFVYYFILDLSCLFGFFFFWPSNNKKFKIDVINDYK